LYVDQAEVDRILAGLPGLGGPSPERAESLLRDLAPVLAAARTAFAESLAGPSTFARTARRAGLDQTDAEALAVLAAIELSPHRMRLLGYLQDNVALPRPTLATLARFWPAGEHRVAPGSALRRAELVEVGADGPWAIRMVAVPPRVLWALRDE